MTTEIQQTTEVYPYIHVRCSQRGTEYLIHRNAIEHVQTHKDDENQTFISWRADPKVRMFDCDGHELRGRDREEDSVARVEVIPTILYASVDMPLSEFDALLRAAYGATS